VGNGLVGKEARRFRFAQWRMLLATMFCYLFFYTGRQAFGFAIPGIHDELGISKADLGWASAAGLWAYAIGQLVNGNLGDKFGGRVMMSMGAMLSCGLNWVVSYGSSVISLGLPLAANGYAQSMGWAPGSRVLSNWWAPSERGKVYGAYVFAAGMASVLAFTTSMLILEFGLNWRWIFRLPVLLLLVGGIVYYLIVRNRPQDMGFPPVHSKDDDDEANDEANDEDEQPTTPDLPTETSWQRYRHAFSNLKFMIACMAIGFQNTARYGLLIWVPVHFLGKNWKDGGGNKWITLALPIGMALGALTSGWLSDRFFHAKRSQVISLFMFLAACFAASMYMLPMGHPMIIPILFLTGFFVYGPQSGFWALCPDLLGHKRAGTGTGVMNTFAYALAGFGEPLIGWLTETYDDTSLVFPAVATACLIGALLSLFIRR